MTSTSGVLRALAPRQPVALTLILLAAVLLTAAQALAHNVTAGDAGYIQEIWGVQIIPFILLVSHSFSEVQFSLFISRCV